MELKRHDTLFERHEANVATEDYIATARITLTKLSTKQARKYRARDPLRSC